MMMSGIFLLPKVTCSIDTATKKIVVGPRCCRRTPISNFHSEKQWVLLRLLMVKCCWKQSVPAPDPRHFENNLTMVLSYIPKYIV